MTNNWNKDLKKGFSFVRNGKDEDYKNTNKRYEKAYKYLNDAYKKLIKSDPKNNFQLAELSLWKGISLNENLDILINHQENAKMNSEKSQNQE